MTIRAFRPDDAGQIADLFTRHTPYRRDAAFWLWLNRTLPVRPSVVAVAELGGEVVGHYGILPLDLRLPDGRTVAAGHGVHALVRPDARHQINIFQISALAYRLARESGIEFLFGFPNANYRLVQEKIERWRSIALFKAWTKPAAERSLPAAGGLVPADLSDDAQLHRAIRLWEELDCGATGIRVVGQSRWWSVRYLLHPQRPYFFYWYVVAGERRGLVVAKRFQGETERRVHLVDYALAAGSDVGDLLRAFENEFIGQADRSVHWPVDRDFERALVAAGYRADGFDTYFGLRPVGATAAESGAMATLLDAGAWRLPLGLSDAF